ncbi:MAG: 50S ribosomal protein L32 [Patescibacteria group bacterium]
MATPKKKMSHHRSRQRRAINLRIAPISGLIVCDHCQQRTRPHQACMHCSYYKGQLVA